ncbi:hypothetical protein ENUP19_0018G0068 [Entamoeba nuttalli]|uniref:Uncharacterized protein n=2 Tax=Entamoeba nuttalli TaxID=412467 RepID=K2GQX3_ENTNP|nr:hypothetical protein ENU1_200020 [Entamoeba nuttalli P19]EKE37373.1 hypothetical protein ENU1_200020 [Entamoeba nuttalli P19]|eukprot:XP_008860303.1 hypothetical protein ENU1_200020 [Entamoeba nuttalli P19]
MNKTILNTPQPPVSDYLEWVTYSILVHEVDEKFEGIREKLKQSLAESYGTIEGVEEKNFKSMCVSNAIHILTQSNYKNEVIKYSQRCDWPLLHLYIISNNDNDGLKKIRTIIRDCTIKQIQIIVIAIGGELRNNKRFNNESAEVKSFYLQPQLPDCDVQIKELLSVIAKSVVNNYEVYLKEYEEEINIKPNNKYLEEAKRFASLCFEASILSQKVGDYTKAVHFIKMGLGQLDVSGTSVDEDIKILKNNVVNLKEINFKRELELITPQSVYTAYNRLEAFIFMIYRMIDLYSNQKNYSSLCIRFNQVLGMMEKYLERINQNGITLPFLYKELFIIDSCNCFLESNIQSLSHFKSTDIIFIYMYKMFTIKHIGETCFTFDCSPDFIHFDMDFVHKAPPLPEQVKLPNCKNSILPDIIKKKEIFDREFELILKQCIELTPENYNRNGTNFLFKKLLGLLYFELNRRDEAKELFKEIILSNTADDITKCFCCIPALQCNCDNTLLYAIYIFLLTYHREDITTVYKNVFKQNNDILKVIQQSTIYLHLNELLSNCKENINLCIPEFIHFFSINVTQGHVQFSFESKFKEELKDVKIELLYKNKIGDSSSNINNVTINPHDIIRLDFDLNLVGLITLNQMNIYLSDYLSITIPINQQVMVRTSKPQFTFALQPPTFIPLFLEDCNQSVVMTINIIEPVDYIAIDIDCQCYNRKDIIIKGAEYEDSQNIFILRSFKDKKIIIECPLKNIIEEGNYEFSVIATAPLYIHRQKVSIPAFPLINKIQEGVPVMRNGRLLISLPILNICPYSLLLHSISFDKTNYLITIDEMLPVGKEINYTIDVTGLEKTTKLDLLIQFKNGVLRLPFTICYSPPSYNVKIEVPKIVRCLKPFLLTAVIQSNRKEDELIIIKIDKSPNIIISGFEKQHVIIKAGETITSQYECIAMDCGSLLLPNIILSSERSLMHVSYEKDISSLIVLPLQSNFYSFASFK